MREEFYTVFDSFAFGMWSVQHSIITTSYRRGTILTICKADWTVKCCWINCIWERSDILFERNLFRMKNGSCYMETSPCSRQYQIPEMSGIRKGHM